MLFQSQRRFFGGSNEALDLLENDYETRFNRRGDSLGGATPGLKHAASYGAKVSIAEAILWGEQPFDAVTLVNSLSGFNRRGDSLGGATPSLCTP